MPSFQKMPDGSWSARFRITSPEGKKIQKRLSGYSKKMEAERAYRNFMASYVPPKIRIVDDGMTFNQLYTLYLEYKKARLKASTIYDINNVIKKRIIPFFGQLLVKNINKIKVLEWQNQLDKDGFSYKYKSNLRGFLSSIFKYGVMYCDLPLNPVQQVEPFRNTEPKKEMQIWTKDEFTRFIAVVDDEVYKTFFATLYFSGCRKGELLAVSWKDVDFTSGILSINKSLTRKEAGKAFAITPPKNSSSIRKLLLPDSCLNLLKALKQKSDPSSTFVFGGNKPLAEQTISRRLEQYCSLSGVKIIRIHDFRHSHASLLISNGESILMVAKRLGHSNIEQTLNTYSHLMPNAEGEMISKLNIIF